jgi:uncharacterized protein (DUF1697 family)
MLALPAQTIKNRDGNKKALGCNKTGSRYNSPMRLQAYVAFLRGVNVGGHGTVSMRELKKAFEDLRFANVTPVLASGNMVFETQPAAPMDLKAKIEAMLDQRFRLSSLVILRSAAEISQLLSANPFPARMLTPQTKVQVTFLGEKLNPAAKFPVRLSSAPFQLMQVSGGEICSAVDLSGAAGTPELMKFLEKQFGKALTTRTWATVEKIGKLMRS